MAGQVIGRLTAMLDLDDARFQSGARAAGSSMRQLGTQSKQAESQIAAAMRDAVKDVDRYAAKAEQARANLAAVTQRQARAEGQLRSAQQSGDGGRIATAEVRLAQARARTTEATNRQREAVAGLTEATRLDAEAASGAADAHEEAGNASETSAGKLAAMGAAAIGAGISLSSILTIGMDYRRTLNTMGAVSDATSAQMSQVSARARELGNDITLPGTSANDAASAMTELSKGGFTVQQSMDAAKGSLTLAAAAQIDAATAAGIQSAALQAFGKDASYASTAADILSNTSNASSAEITDVADALQQSGTVANGFGVSMADTATMIGLFANAGITGSDAGTLLKTSLQSLTKNTEPVNAAIEELGLNIYNQKGEFVGLRPLWEQLSTASHRLSDEQFLAATNTLFGSDAMRGAMVAAGGGTAAFDKMSAAIGKQGSAAQLANAKMQGLPGAWERVQNALESAALAGYEMAEGSLTALANSGADVIGVGEDLFGVLSVVLTPITALVQGFGALPGPIQTTVVAVAAMRVASMLMGNQIGAVQSRLGGGVSRVREFGTAMRISAEQTRAAHPQLNAASRAMMTLGGAAQLQQGAIGRIGKSFSDAAGGAQRFGTLAGGAAAGLTTMRIGMGGLMGALGGPWGLAITGAIGALTLWMSKKRQDAAASQEAATRTRTWADQLSESGGKLTQSFKSNVFKEADDDTKKLDGSGKSLAKTLKDMGVEGDATVNAILKQGTSYDDLKKHLQDVVKEHTRIKTSSAGAKSGMAETETEVTKTGQSAQQALTRLNELAGSYEAAQTKAQQTAKAVGDVTTSADGSQQAVGPLSKAMTEFAESTEGAASNADKLTKALDGLNADGLTKEDALQQWSDGMRDFTKALGEGGAAAIQLNGHVDVTTEKGSALQDAVQKQSSSFNQLATSALSSGDSLESIRAKLQGSRQAFVDQITAVTGNRQAAEALADTYGLMPDQVITRLNVQGMADALKGLESIKVKASTIPEGKVKVVDSTPENIAHLTELGIKTTKLPDGRIAITDTSAETINRLNTLGVRTTSLPGGFVKVDDTTPENLKHLADVGLKTTTLPNGVVVIDANDAAFKAAVANATKPERKQITIDYKALGDIAIKPDGTVDMDAQRAKFGRADGAIVPMADGGLRQISKPRVADIYAGRGDGTIFAEQETGGEAYIPLAPSKRDRSVSIVSEVASLFGMALVKPMADGGINAGYGLPPGSTGGFPEWVTALGNQYGVKPSTYAGHQESNRTEAGYAPNPQGLNRGIDWGGSTAQMQAFAEAMYARAQGDPAIEQIIWQNPETGEKIGWHGRSPDADGSYFASDYPAHQNHVHLRLGSQLGAGAGAAGQPGVRSVPLVQNPDGTWTSTDPAWAALIKRESGGDADVVQGVNDVNSGGNEASGLFQIAKGTWAANGGTEFAATAGEADPEKQSIVAARIFDKSGGNPWGAGLAGREDEAALRAGITDMPTADPSAAGASGSGQPVFVTNWPSNMGSTVVASADSGSSSSSTSGSSGGSTGTVSKTTSKNSVATATTAVDTAKRRQADAAGRLHVAETKLGEVRANSKAKASQLEAAEERVAKAKRDSEAASNKVTAAEQKLKDARTGTAAKSVAKLPDNAKGRGPLPLVAYARGGIDSRAPGQASMLNSERMWITQAGEAGTEAYIPLNGSDRSRALWTETGRRLGMLQSFADGGFGGYTDDTSDYMKPNNFYDWAALTAGAGFTAVSAITPYASMIAGKQVDLGNVSPTLDTGSNSVDGIAQALGTQLDAISKQFGELLQATRENKKVYVTNQPSSGDGAASMHLLTAGM